MFQAPPTPLQLLEILPDPAGRLRNHGKYSGVDPQPTPRGSQGFQPVVHRSAPGTGSASHSIGGTACTEQYLIPMLVMSRAATNAAGSNYRKND